MSTREIKFRAWDSATKQFWKPAPQGMIYFDIFNVPEFIGNTHNEKTVDGKEVCERRFQIMQFTGMKDCNGADIYEGDIVLEKVSFGTKGKHPKKTGEFIMAEAVVIFTTSDCYEPRYRLKQTRKGEIKCLNGNAADWYRSHYGFNCCEIIGNIHQHPNLLGE